MFGAHRQFQKGLDQIERRRNRQANSVLARKEQRGCNLPNRIPIKYGPANTRILNKPPSPSQTIALGQYKCDTNQQHVCIVNCGNMIQDTNSLRHAIECINIECFVDQVPVTPEADINYIKMHIYDKIRKCFMCGDKLKDNEELFQHITGCLQRKRVLDPTQLCQNEMSYPIAPRVSRNQMVNICRTATQCGYGSNNQNRNFIIGKIFIMIGLDSIRIQKLIHMEQNYTSGYDYDKPITLKYNIVTNPPRNNPLINNDWIGKFYDPPLKRNIGAAETEGIFIVTEKGSGQEFVVKKLIKTSEKHIYHISEIKCLIELHHPNICPLLHLFENNVQNTEVYFLVMPKYLCNGLQFIQAHDMIGMNVCGMVRDQLEGVADALNYCHKKGVIHRDIKPENIVIGQCGIMKLVDFGHSYHAPYRTEKGTECPTSVNVGTGGCRAPEIGKAQRYGPKVDVYCFAVLVLMFLFGLQFYFNEENSHNLIINLLKTLSSNYKYGYIIDINFLFEMLSENPKQRPSMEQVVLSLKEKRRQYRQFFDPELVNAFLSDNIIKNYYQHRYQKYTADMEIRLSTMGGNKEKEIKKYSKFFQSKLMFNKMLQKLNLLNMFKGFKSKFN